MLSCSFIKDKQATDTVRVPQEVDPWVHLSVSVNNAGANRIDGQTCNDTYLLVDHAGWRWRGFQEGERRRGVRAVIRAFNVCLTIRQVGPGGSLGPPRGTVGHGKQGGGTSTTNHDGALNVCLTSCRDRQAWEKVVWAGKGVIRETPTALFILDLGSTASWQVALGNTTMYVFYHVCLHCSVGLQQYRTYDHNVQGNEVKMQWAY